jgi:hypothetical protein
MTAKAANNTLLHFLTIHNQRREAQQPAMLKPATRAKLQNMALHGTDNERATAINLLNKHTQPKTRKAAPHGNEERLSRLLKQPHKPYTPPQPKKGFTPPCRAQQYETAAEKAKRQKQFISVAYAQMLEQKDNQEEYYYSSAKPQPPTETQANTATLFFIIIIILFLAAL